ncbi:Placenta-Expressed Transcript 1 Protein [Manis pentadactyla]|nr:Placenta-Expressed Transcript 1 Protein [Manis pentadactyla]
MVTSTRRCIPGGTLGQVPEASSRPGRSGTDICTYDLTQELWPGAYKRVSQRSRPVPGPAVSAEIKTMAARKSTLFPLGLGLCLGVLFASASSAERNDTCHFTEVFTPGPGIKANLDVYKNNTVYTVSVPVNSSISSVVLRALDTNHHPVGHWQKADEHCNSSALYHMKDSHRVLFQADWVSPNSTNVTTVELQAFVVSLNNTATLSSLKLTSIGLPEAKGSDFPNPEIHLCVPAFRWSGITNSPLWFTQTLGGVIAKLVFLGSDSPPEYRPGSLRETMPKTSPCVDNHNLDLHTAHDPDLHKAHDIDLQAVHDLDLHKAHNIDLHTAHDLDLHKAHNIDLHAAHDLDLHKAHDLDLHKAHDLDLHNPQEQAIHTPHPTHNQKLGQ